MIPITGKLSGRESEQVTYSSRKLPCKAITIPMANANATTTSPMASKRKLRLRVSCSAPNTLHMFTDCILTGTSAIKKFTKLMKAMITIASAMAERVRAVDLTPAS